MIPLSRSRCFLSLLWCSSLCAMNPAASKMNEFNWMSLYLIEDWYCCRFWICFCGLSKCNFFTESAISATTSACHVNVIHRKKERNQASDRILSSLQMMLCRLGWKLFPPSLKNIISTILSNRPESLPSSSSFLLWKNFLGDQSSMDFEVWTFYPFLLF